MHASPGSHQQWRSRPWEQFVSTDCAAGPPGLCRASVWQCCRPHLRHLSAALPQAIPFQQGPEPIRSKVKCMHSRFLILTAVPHKPMINRRGQAYRNVTSLSSSKILTSVSTPGKVSSFRGAALNFSDRAGEMAASPLHPCTASQMNEMPQAQPKHRFRRVAMASGHQGLHGNIRTIATASFPMAPRTALHDCAETCGVQVQWPQQWLPLALQQHSGQVSLCSIGQRPPCRAPPPTFPALPAHAHMSPYVIQASLPC